MQRERNCIIPDLSVPFDPNTDETFTEFEYTDAFIRKSGLLSKNRKLFCSTHMIAFFQYPCYLYTTPAYNESLKPVLCAFIKRCIPSANFPEHLFHSLQTGTYIVVNNKFRKMGLL